MGASRGPRAARVGAAIQRGYSAERKRSGAVGLRYPVRLLFVAAWVFVPGSYFQSTLKHPIGFGEYLTLSWLGASLATVAGALGASLEDEERVREASYGYRQRRRHEDDDDDPEDES
jgi:hypothetical protein